MKSFSLININCWDDFKVYAESMPNTKSMGDAFEQLTKLYFQINPLYRSKYDQVWLLDEVPSKVLEYLDLPRQDLGIDLIAKSGDEYHAIQCKYHSDKTNTVKNSEISTFTSILANKKNLSHGYICSTALSTSRNFNKLEIENISNILFDTWSFLDKDFFDKARQKLKKKVPQEKPFTPKPHQENAIKLAHKHFVKENNSRGKLIFPCGSGKSLTGFWMMEKLKANSTIVAVPSLSLVKQTLEVYLKQVVAKNINVKWLCICSDEGIGKSDDVVTYTRDLPVPCTTDPDYIKKWLKDNKNDNIIIFTTYQSGRLIAEASKSLKFTFDLGVYDEAHKTVGKNENLFSYLLFEENISVKHRIFMTATERFYRGVRDDVLTMDDPDDYGDVFCHMSFKEAIEQGLLTDYKIITIEVNKEEIAAFIKDNNLVKSNSKWGKENEARSLASMIALRKAMKTLPIKNAVSFHSSIERATRNKEVQKHITETYNYKPIDTYHVSGKLPTTKRNDVVQEFAKSNSALITNSRCLTEGVDVPNIDCIVFADPRKSKVDIVQALGRALRKKDGKEWGYVVLPVIYDYTSHEIDNDNFQEILNVVRGLAANDERIVEEFKDKAQNTGRVTGAREEIFSIDPVLLEESELVGNLNIKLWGKLSRFNWMPFEEARKYVRKLNLKSYREYKDYLNENIINLPYKPWNSYKNLGWIDIGDFLGTFSKSKFGRVYKSFDDAKKFLSKLNLKSRTEWIEYYRSGKKPDDIPANLYKHYKGNPKWKGFGDFIGSGIVASNKMEFLSFKDAKKRIQDLNFKTQKEYFSLRKTKNFPSGVPSNPNAFYKKDWKGWSDFLGTGNIGKLDPDDYFNFEKAKKFMLKLKLKNVTEWNEYKKSKNFNSKIPRSPQTLYKEEGWIGFGDFLGNNNISNSSKKFKSFNQSKKFIIKLKLKSIREFKNLKRDNKIPEDIPSNPDINYKKDWKGWSDFLGTTIIAPQNKIFYNYKQAKAYVKALNIKSSTQWREYKKYNKLDPKMPRGPAGIYKDKGWKGWADFLGKED